MYRYNVERLAEVERFVQLKSDIDHELQEIVQLAAEICSCSIAMITLMDGETQFVKFTNGVSIEKVNYMDTFCQFTLQNKALTMVPDATKDQRFINNPFVMQSPYLKFYAGMPLVSELGSAIGTLCVFDTKTKVLTAVEMEMLQSLSQQVTWLLEFEMTQQVLKQQYEESVASSQTLMTYFKSSSACHLLMDQNMCVIAFNQAMNDLLLANHNTVMEEGMDVSKYVHPEFIREFTECFQKAMKGENSIVEKHLQYASGNKICWSLSFDSANNYSGERIGVSFNATDITANINNQERVKNQLEAIAKINQIQTSELIEPIDAIVQKTTKICNKTEMNSLFEINLLRNASLELDGKKKKLHAIANEINKIEVKGKSN